jgi:hypothetical protein
MVVSFFSYSGANVGLAARLRFSEAELTPSISCGECHLADDSHSLQNARANVTKRLVVLVPSPYASI